MQGPGRRSFDGPETGSGGPIRVAFLVEEGEHDALVLDGIFADSYYRWGGRFSLVVPCRDRCIPDTYWAWLEAYDPDVVYSCVGLSRADILEVHERLGPGLYRVHDEGRAEPRLDVHGFKPRYDFQPLSSLSTIFRLARYGASRHEGSGPFRIIDSWHTEDVSRLLGDNLGTYHASNGGSILPADALSAVSLQTVVSDEFFDGPYGVPRDLDRLQSELAAFSAFAERKASSLSLISALYTPRLSIRSDWSTSFNLVVGDTFADRILFWNSRLHIPSWLDGDLCCFRVTLDALRRPEVQAMVGELLKRRNQVNNGNGGKSEVTVSSASLNAEDLNEALELVGATRPWSRVMQRAVGSLDDLVPKPRELDRSIELSPFFGGPAGRPRATRINWTSPKVDTPPVQPDHLLDAPPRQHFAKGFWANDYDIQQQDPGPRFSAHNLWRLPRRWRMADAFGVTYRREGGHVLPPQARTTRSGSLTLFVNTDRTVERIAVPNSLQAIYWALSRDGAFAVDEPDRGRVDLPTKIADASASNEARYLTGVLGLATGLVPASSYFLHPFLRKVFADLGGTPTLPIDKIERTASRLDRIARKNAVFDLAVERDKLAALIVRAAGELKSPRAYLTHDAIKQRWATYRAGYWLDHPLQRGTDDEAYWEAAEVRSLERCLIDLRSKQILFQGNRWTCTECHHKNWRDLEALSATMTCTVCRAATPAPIEVQWQFRANEFLIESLRDHSSLSLIWVLDLLRRRSRSSFFYVGPTEFRYDRDAINSDVEADLLVVTDGQCLVCEVKSSWAVMRRSDIEKLVELARRLRPDTAVLAVMEHGDGGFAEITAAAAEALARDGIGFELIVPPVGQDGDDPYLPDFHL